MIFLYTTLLVLLGLLKVVVAWRAASLERKYARVANQASKLGHEATFKPGNSGTPRNDFWAQTAKRQYELGLLVSRRDRLEAKHFAWQSWADKLGRLVTRLRHWKGQKLPYTMGVLDVWLVLYLLDRAGLGELLNPRQVLETVTALLSK